MFFPYLVDVPMSRWPIANFLIIAGEHHDEEDGCQGDD